MAFEKFNKEIAKIINLSIENKLQNRIPKMRRKCNMARKEERYSLL